MPAIAIDRIVAGKNARTIVVPAALDEGLRRSIAAVGILQPVLLRPIGEAFAVTGPLEIVLGSRRLRAARALGMSEMPAEIRVMTDIEVEEAQVAENVQREAMHPVDQWRAVRELIQDYGPTFEEAGAALGLDDRLMRRMEQLGCLNPTLLKLAEIDMPTPTQLRKIAAASKRLQTSAAAIKGLIIARGEKETVDWARVVACCERRRIARALAIFDVTKRTVAWDEDLFAEPGADDQFTTSDIDGFVKHQTKALQARVADAVKAKKRHQVTTMKDSYNIAFPGGFKPSYGKPDQLKRNEWAFYAVAADGSIRVETAIDTKAVKAAEKKAAASVTPAGDAASGQTNVDADADETVASLEEHKVPFTKKGMALIATAKTEALRKALEQTSMHPANALTFLVLALTARNVRVIGSDGFIDLATRLLTPGGTLAVISDADIVSIAQTAIGRILHFEGADSGGLYNSVFSGDAAEWVGAAVNAGNTLDRFDTAEFLDTASLAELKRAVAAAGLITTAKTAAKLREGLIGHAPDYRPEAAQFGAPARKERMQ